MYASHIVLDFEMNPVCGESEDARTDLCEEIIEIGAVKLNSSGQKVDSFSCMIRPQYSPEILTGITNLTGICIEDVSCAETFGASVGRFSRWIGEEKTRIYSWSDSDLIQFERECRYKNVAFPSNMKKWMDLQAIYPRIMNLSKRRAKVALHIAAKENGIEFDEKKAHRALYDAEKTAELLIQILSGEYKKRIEKMKSVMRSEVVPMTNSMDSVSGGKLAQLLQILQAEEASGQDEKQPKCNKKQRDETG